MGDIVSIHQPTCVYFIQAGEGGPIKIGYSSNVEKRIEQLQTGSAQPLKLLAKFAHPNARDIEQAFHAQFAAHRQTGEWFEPTPCLLTTIDAWLAAEGALKRPSALDHIRASDARTELNGHGWWVVEWSDREQQMHVGPLMAALSATHDALLMGGGVADYIIVAVCVDADEALEMATVLEPWIRAATFLRRSGANVDSWRRRFGVV